MSSQALWALESFTQGSRSMEESLPMVDIRTHSQGSLRSLLAMQLNSVKPLSSSKLEAFDFFFYDAPCVY
ncbi:hypothetical protein XENORESO_013803 [Xenotaenia resolanae]|uniref:Uncharacterized protein n=1 Tax=Xenotaenia resolanae TaxID=208358 RepID=A0ABV0WKJ9_9TELE